MNSRTARLLKEARALFWPWCAVAVAAVLPLVRAPRSSADLIIVWFLLGFLVLATLPFGNEFQHRTLSLLLAQPVERTEIWSEKLSVMAVAVLSAALIWIVALRLSAHQLDPYDVAFFGAWIVATTASATYWTLFARSMLGGLALNVSVNALVIEMPWLVLYHEKVVAVSLPPPKITVATITFVLLCYAGAMLWLGRRKLARFQVTGGVAGDDLLMAGPSVMPEALAGLFRCRPTGAFLNLIRKELRLLRPVWLITLVSVLGWTCLTMLRLVPEHGFGRLFPRHPGSPTFLLFMAVGLVAALSIAISILAGVLSLGEERTSGTHAWHMILPVSARSQWLIKLVIAMLTGLVCAGLLPVLVLIAGGSLYGSPLMFVDTHGAVVWLVTIPLLTFASFWCACAVNGTVRAGLWLFPVMTAVFFASEFGEPDAGKVMDFIVSSFGLFTNFRFTNGVSNLQSFVADVTQLEIVTLLVVPALLIAVIQSYRLFRAQPQDSALSVVRNLAPLAITVFLCSFSLAAFSSFVYHAREQMGTLFRETHDAIEKIQPGGAKLDAAHPLKLTVNDLAKVSPLSERTRRWLRNSTITVIPDETHSGRYRRGRIGWGASVATGGAYSRYLATIQLASGSDCTVSFEAGRGISFGILGGVCE